LVVGGGIAGMNAALDLAEMGFKVYMLENTESIGGHMAALDKTFPTLDCSICIEGPKMVDCGRHPNIQIFANSELVRVDGYVGNFKVKIRKRPRYVIPERCTGCGECRDACPIEFPNEWDMNLGTRKAISVPFDQAVPLIYTLNKDYCIECYKCVDVCGAREAINFDQQPEEVDIEVGAIVVSTGFDVYLPYDMPLLGYGKYPNVITGMEFERLILAAGPTGGKVIRQSDGKKPHSVAFVLCVGSRDKNKYPYCSNYCCMYTLKHVVQLKEKYKEDIEVYVFFMDIRSPGKGYEEFYRRLQEEGITFLRGRPAEVTDQATKPEEQGKLIVVSEDTLLGRPIRVPVDMVILCTAMESRQDTIEVSRIFGVNQGADGFFLEEHPKLGPMSTATDGVYLAGTCQGPKDIPDTVSHASGAAAQALALATRGRVEISPTISWIDPDVCAGCQTCIGLCAYSAIEFDARRRVSVVNEALCKGCGSCAVACCSRAIRPKHFKTEQILTMIEACLRKDLEEEVKT